MNRIEPVTHTYRKDYGVETFRTNVLMYALIHSYVSRKLDLIRFDVKKTSSTYTKSFEGNIFNFEDIQL